MTVTVKFFASLRESLGVDETIVETHTIDTLSLTVADVWQAVTKQDTLPNNIFAAINHEYVTMTTLVNDGDEVAFFPQITGG